MYELDGEVHRTPIATLRGDYRLPDGTTGNHLRRWEKGDFGPRPEDIFQERLYCIQWISRETLQLRRQRLFFAAPGSDDLAREHMVEAIVRDNLARWQEQGLVPSMPIEPGDKTDEPIRTRGWTYWHHLFPARHLLIGAMIRERMLQFDASILLTGIAVGFCRALNLMSKLTRWRSFQRTGGLTGGLVDFSGDVFYNQALNTVVNYGSRSFVSLMESLSPKIRHHPVCGNGTVCPHPATEIDRMCDYLGH